MKRHSITAYCSTIALGLCFFALAAQADEQASCLKPEQLKQLDARYEEALRVGDHQFLADLLAEDFVWIHNHASQFETRDDLLRRLQDNHRPLKARDSTEVVVRRLDNTAVIHGFTTVDQFTDNNSRRANRYQFIRTYVAVAGGCKLLAGQTMKVWSTEGAVE